MFKPKPVVVDTSVIVKWLNKTNELLIEQADKLFHHGFDNKIEIFVPELVKYEVGNALLNKKMELPMTKNSIASLYGIPLKFISLDSETAGRVVEIASESKITYYDASFLALAEKLKAVLVTDNPKHQKLPGGKFKVIALKDY